jgi:hypothetical protein
VKLSTAGVDQCEAKQPHIPSVCHKSRINTRTLPRHRIEQKHEHGNLKPQKIKPRKERKTQKNIQKKNGKQMRTEPNWTLLCIVQL